VNPRLLERALLGDVVDVGACFDPPDVVEIEEGLRQEALRFSPVSHTAEVRAQRGPDIERPRLLVGAVRHRVPAHVADDLTILDALDEQLPAIWRDHPLAVGQVLLE
jgi:hypothetical protein